jgi:hypothetical protein
MPISLECRIETQPEYRVGKPITVKGSLLNTGSKAVWVLKWNTFLEGMWGHFVRLTLQGAPVPYEGILGHRGNPRPENYVHLPPGEAVSGSVDLNDAYPISRPGDYQVSFQLALRHAFEEGDGTAPRPPAAQQPITLHSNTASLHVVPGGPPLPTKGAAALARRGDGVVAPARAPRALGSATVEPEAAEDPARLPQRGRFADPRRSHLGVPEYHRRAQVVESGQSRVGV